MIRDLILSFIIILSANLLSANISFRRFVKFCPKTETLWKNRSWAVGCPFEYHCFLVNSTTMAEVCMEPQEVAFRFGCPILETSNQSMTLTFLRCNSNTVDCPSGKSETYSTSKLYKYPACFQPRMTLQSNTKVKIEKSDAKTTFPVTLRRSTETYTSPYRRELSTLIESMTSRGIMQPKRTEKRRLLRSFTVFWGVLLCLVLPLWIIVCVLLIYDIKRITSAVSVMGEEEPVQVVDGANGDSNPYDTIDDVDIYEYVI